MSKILFGLIFPFGFSLSRLYNLPVDVLKVAEELCGFPPLIPLACISTGCSFETIFTEAWR